MLYDNALLARAYLHGWLVSGDDDAAPHVAEETLEFILRELQGPEGGFYSALDADSEGEEGRFYVWAYDDLLDALEPADAEAAVVWFGATAQGNFEGTNVLESRGPEPPPEQRARIRERLHGGARRSACGRASTTSASPRGTRSRSASSPRPAPASGARTSSTPRVATPSSCSARCATARAGCCARRTGARAKLNAYLEDHAFLVEALLDLYEATFEPRWFAAAREIADAMIARFADEERGGFFTTSDDHEQLVTRRKDIEDNPIPSGSSSAALGLLRLAALTGEETYERHGLSVLRPRCTRSPRAIRRRSATCCSRSRSPCTRRARSRSRATGRELRSSGCCASGSGPRSCSPPATATDAGGVPLLEGRTPVDGRAAAYVCERFACQRPVTEPGAAASAARRRDSVAARWRR